VDAIDVTALKQSVLLGVDGLASIEVLTAWGKGPVTSVAEDGHRPGVLTRQLLLVDAVCIDEVEPRLLVAVRLARCHPVIPGSQHVAPRVQ
jgi:hypothetical protein